MEKTHFKKGLPLCTYVGLLKISVSGCFSLITTIEVKLVRSKHATPTFSCQSLVRQGLDLIHIDRVFGLVTLQTDGYIILHQNGV